MDDRLQAYLKEYEMLTAENRLWLAANDPKLNIAFTACIGIASAGVWKGVYTMFLIIPFVVVFLAFILLFQFSNIVHLAAQLAVLEEKINALIGSEPTLTYFSRTVIRIFDHPVCRDPQTGRRRVSLILIYGCFTLGVMVFGSALVLWYALPKLAVQNLTMAVVYATALAISVVFFCILFIQISRSKKFYMNVIKENFDTDKKASNNCVDGTA